MTIVRLALGGIVHSSTQSGLLKSREGWRREDKPSLLISYFYRQNLGLFDPRDVRDWVLDSGAFSAFGIGAKIDLDEYIDFCKNTGAWEPPREIFGLDVIGDWETGLRNVEAMWSEGIEAIPTYHIGEPREVLEHIVTRYPKIAISVSGTRLRGAKLIEWTEQVFSIAWPKKIHGFALVRSELLNRFPFHSVDSTSWKLAPHVFGNWKSKLGRSSAESRQPAKGISVKGGYKDLRDEEDYYLRMERRLRERWKRELAMLDALEVQR